MEMRFKDCLFCIWFIEVLCGEWDRVDVLVEGNCISLGVSDDLN